MTSPSSDVAFSASVKAVQEARGSRAMFARREATGGFRTTITPQLTAFLAEVDTAYLATASAAGQPYAQHRGGPPGFIQVLGPDLLGFADYAGNRQYITTGNLAENDRAFLFLMDYARGRRIKLWGHARMTSDQDLISRLMPDGYKAVPEQALLFKVDAWDSNCSQHIPRKVDLSAAAAMIAQRDARISALEEQLANLQNGQVVPVTHSNTPVGGT